MRSGTAPPAGRSSWMSSSAAAPRLLPQSAQDGGALGWRSIQLTLIRLSDVGRRLQARKPVFRQLAKPSSEPCWSAEAAMSHDSEQVGYRKPPKATQFKKGKSGNPR